MSTLAHNLFTQKSKSLGLLIALTLLVGECAAQTELLAQSPDQTAIDSDEARLPFTRPLFGLSHNIGAGIGYRRDFTSLEAFIPLIENQPHAIVFGDFRALLERDEGPRAMNLGLGHRFFSPSWNGVLGCYLYYDYRQTDRSDFQQLSPGIEYLHEWWEFRANGYLANIFDDREQLENRFTGHHLLIDRAEVAYSGFDAEIGVNLPLSERLDARLYGGGYYFDASNDRPAAGWKSRAELQISDDISVGVSVQNDQVFDTTVNGRVVIQFPQAGIRRLFRRDSWNRNNNSLSSDRESRLNRRVERQQNIIVQQDEGTVALNPATGTPQFFLHVDDSNLDDPDSTSLDGTFERAFSTLDPASNADSGTIVYVRQSITRESYNSSDFILRNGSQLLSNRAAQLVETQLGEQRLPFSGKRIGILLMMPPDDGMDDGMDGNFKTVTKTVFDRFRRTLEPLPRISGNIVVGGDNVISGFTLPMNGTIKAFRIPESTLRIVENQISTISITNFRTDPINPFGPPSGILHVLFNRNYGTGPFVFEIKLQRNSVEGEFSGFNEFESFNFFD